MAGLVAAAKNRWKRPQALTSYGDPDAVIAGRNRERAAASAASATRTTSQSARMATFATKVAQCADAAYPFATVASSWTTGFTHRPSHRSHLRCLQTTMTTMATWFVAFQSANCADCRVEHGRDAASRGCVQHDGREYEHTPVHVPPVLIRYRCQGRHDQAREKALWSKVSEHVAVDDFFKRMPHTLIIQ